MLLEGAFILRVLKEVGGIVWSQHFWCFKPFFSPFIFHKHIVKIVSMSFPLIDFTVECTWNSLPPPITFTNNLSFQLIGRHSIFYPIFVCTCALSRVWLCNPMNCSPTGSSVHQIFRASRQEWGASSYSVIYIFKFVKVFHTISLKTPEYCVLDENRGKF